MEPIAILSFGVSKLLPKPASLAAHPAAFGVRTQEHDSPGSITDLLKWFSPINLFIF
jgi:hypothetical protein